MNEFIMSEDSRAAAIGGHLDWTINYVHSGDYLMCLHFQKAIQINFSIGSYNCS